MLHPILIIAGGSNVVSPNEKLGVAIQGAGTVSSGHLRAYLRNPYVQVVAIGSRTKEGARQKALEVGIDPSSIAIYDSIDDVVSDANVDALSITTPHQRHAFDAITAANAGKHCLIEKPIALNRDEVLAIDAAVTESGVKTACGFVLRYIPMVLAQKAMIDQGLLGNELYVQTDYWHNPEQSGYPGAENHIQHADSSAMLTGGCHAVDLARYLMGSDIVQVSAVSTSGVSDAPFPLMQSAVVTFANGKIGKVSACTEQWMPYQFNTDILGTEGGIRDNRFYSRKLPGVTDWATFPTVTPNSGLVSHHPFDGEISHFIDCIRNDVESHANVRDSVNTHLAVFAIDESTSSGKVIRID
jgi:predicted dehydrogenase